MKDRYKKIYLWIIIAIAVLSMIPLLVLSFYNHPSVDDYLYAIDTYHVWNETHSICLVLKEAVETSSEFYQSWQGLYVSAFVLSLQPAIFGEEYYAVTGFLMLGIIYGGNLIFSYYIMHKRLQCQRLESIACGCLLSFVMVQWIPSVVQGLYWFNGAMNYVLFFAVLQCFVCGLLAVQRSHDRGRDTRNVIIVVLLGIILAGGNHVTAFMGILTAVAFVVLSILQKEKKRMLRSMCGLLAVGGGFIVNISSPGTQIRQSQFSNTPGMFTSIWLAIKTGVKGIDQWVGLAVILSFLFLLPIVICMVNRICEQTRFQFRYPLVVFIASVGWCCAMFCPPIYGMGTTGDLRITNVVYFSFVILFFINAFYFCGWYVAQQRKVKNKVLLVDVSATWNLTVAVLLVGLVLACGEKMSSYQAMIEIRSGEAQQYSLEADGRYQVLANAKGQDVVLKPFSVHPYLLYYEDIVQDADDWRNSYLAEYFELNSVTLE